MINQAAKLPERTLTGTAMQRIDVGGIPFVAATLPELSEHLCRRAASGRGGWVVTPNLDILRRWQRDASFRELVQDATHFTADGSPIVWASQLQGTPLPARLAGSDLFVDLYVKSARAGLRIALIGGNPGAAEAAVKALAQRNGLPDNVTRTLCPPVGFESIPSEMAALETMLHEWEPHIVFVGLGSPKQEKLIAALRCHRPQAVFLGVGISFSFVAGEVARAPRWAQLAGLEWLHRLIQEPGRLGARYLKYGLPFAGELLLTSWMRRFKT